MLVRSEVRVNAEPRRETNAQSKSPRNRDITQIIQLAFSVSRLHQLVNQSEAA